MILKNNFVNRKTASFQNASVYSFFLEQNPEFIIAGDGHSGPKMTEGQIFRAVANREINGAFLLLDFETPIEQQEYFDNFPLFFCNSNVSADDSTKLQKSWFCRFGTMKKPPT